MPGIRAKTWWILGAFVAAALLAFALGRKPLAIAYHRKKMEKAMQEAVEDVNPEISIVQQLWHDLFGAGSYDSSDDPLNRYDYHRDCLVDLGYLVHREFVFEHLLSSTDESRALWKIVSTKFPSRHTTMSYSETPEPVRLQVWDRPGMIPKWEAFVREHDVPDFLERFQDEISQVEAILTQKAAVPLNGRSPVELAVELSGKWNELGAWLPAQEEVAFFSLYFDETRTILAERLQDPDRTTRLGAAYVIQEIGLKARGLRSALYDALEYETEPNNRIYLYDALRAIGETGEDLLTFLRARLNSDGPEDPYEILYAASAVYNLSDDPEERGRCVHWVCSYLRPSGDADWTSEEYSVRLNGVQALAKMPGAVEAIPVLEALAQNLPKEQTLLQSEIPRTIRILHSRAP